VKNGAELLDRLIKDIVSESAASYISVLHISEDLEDQSDDEDKTHSIEAHTAFSLPDFIPLLQERINVLNPFTRTFLVSWINLLDSIPDLELVTYLPSFLGGLFKFLSDHNLDVHTATQTALDKFLSEIKKIARVKRGIAESRKSAGDDGMKHSTSSVRSAQTMSSTASIPPDQQLHEDSHDDDSLDSQSVTATDEKLGSTDGDWIPGQDVQVDHTKIMEILVTFLSESSGMSVLRVIRVIRTYTEFSPEEEIQLTTLRWIDSFFEICPEDMMPFVPRLLSHVLPTMSHDVEQVRQAANRVNTSLMDYIMSLSDATPKPEAPPSATLQIPSVSAVSGENRRDSNISSKLPRTSSRDPTAEMRSVDARTIADVRTPTPAEERSLPPRQGADLDYQAAVNALTLQFLNEHEATRVAAIAWLIMLHRKAPGRVSESLLRSHILADCETADSFH
jgi:vacuole morphology and inheritance protein 14